MTCGKLQIQSCGLLWFLSTVYLVHIAMPKVAGIRRSTSAVFNLVIQRPRIAGSCLTIPLDSNVKVLPCFGKERFHNTLRLQYGVHGTRVVMRASSAVELEKWTTSIMTAVAASQDSTEHIPVSAILHTCESASESSTTKTNLHRAKKLEATRSNPRHARTSPQAVRTPTNCSLRRMVRQNVPTAMQFFITVGQIIASAS